MSNSHRADVIVAESDTRVDGHLDESSTTVIPAADVAPDPARRIIMVAATKAAGSDEARERGFEPIAVVTPRSPHAAYGLVADDIVWSDALTADDRATLEPHVLPAIALTKAE